MATELSGRATDSSRAPANRLTVAVTGAGGTIGPALLRRLAASPAIERVIALGRHRIEEIEGQGTFEFRRIDVRDREAVKEAVAGAEVIVHMAFSLYGALQGDAKLFETNVRGTANVTGAAREVGARRFVYTSSAAVYGGARGAAHPAGEDREVRAAARLFYARHKAQAELVVREILDGADIETYIFRPCAVAGPHAAGAPIRRLPRALVRSGRRVSALALRVGIRPALPPPPVPLQFVHEDDVAQAVELAILGRGEPGIYNLAGEGQIDGADVLRALGLRALPLPQRLIGASLQLLGVVPPLVPVLGWSELVKEPALVDARKAHERLGWQPRFSSAETLAATRGALGW